MRILFITDSLGAPRPAVPWEYTYPALLQLRFCNIAGVSFCYETKRGSTTACLNNPDLLASYLPDLAIVQLGIVDCVPRIFTQLENSILIRLPGWIRNELIWLGKHLRTRSVKRAYVKPEACRRNWQTFLRKTNEMNCRVVIIPVALPGKVFFASNPEAEEAIRKYNEMIRCLAESVPNARVLPDWNTKDEAYDGLFFSEDGYHLSKIGHERMAKTLLLILEENNK